MQVIVSGNIPPAAGLSSSSALVSSAAFATTLINDVRQISIIIYQFDGYFEKLIDCHYLISEASVEQIQIG